MERQYRQIRVTQGNRELVTNVEDHKKLKVGSIITLTEENEFYWKVEWIADNTRPASGINTHRTWTNNI